jgi:hypothetical protein
MNKPIQPYTHGFLDYIVGLFLLVSPWLLRFHDVSHTATMTMVVMGIIVLGLSLLTNYPLGAIKAIPFPTHGILETIGAIILLVSPWILHFNDIVRTATIEAVLVSIVWLGVVAMTNYTYQPRGVVH